jgi:acetyl-CoA carboxylase carboxyl transferase subunit alpha
VDPTDIHFEDSLFAIEAKIGELRSALAEADMPLDRDVRLLERAYERARAKIYDDLTAWQKVWLARRPARPRGSDYVQALIEDPVAMHSDGVDGDDPALHGGVGWFEGRPVVYLSQQKGRNTKENILTNFGMMHPQGYRKARRLMRLAAKFDRPIIAFVDTPAAHPGVNAETRGQATAIAENLLEMAGLPVPIIAVVVGEGGSGGALGVAMGNAVLMLEYSVYCVAPPEACSGILWKDSGEHAPEAAEGLKLTAKDLLKYGIIDEIISEPAGGAHRDPPETFRRVRQAIRQRLVELSALDADGLVAQRYDKYRSMGVYETGGLPAA